LYDNDVTWDNSKGGESWRTKGGDENEIRSFFREE
jgi:hypothetical protein